MLLLNLILFVNIQLVSIPTLSPPAVDLLDRVIKWSLWQRGRDDLYLLSECVVVVRDFLHFAGSLKCIVKDMEARGRVIGSAQGRQGNIGEGWEERRQQK